MDIWRRNLPMFRGAPRAIDCDVRIWCVVHFLYGWLFDWGLCGLSCSSWVWVDLGIRSQVWLVFSLLSWVLCSLHCDTLLRLYGLRRGVLFSLIAWVQSRLCCLGKLRIRLTLWCMNVNNWAGACARTELRWSCCGFRLTWDWWEMNWSMSGHERRHWKAPSLTDHCLRVISRVWLDRHWLKHARQNGTLVWRPKGRAKLCSIASR
jgi:hypothetical protein